MYFFLQARVMIVLGEESNDHDDDDNNNEIMEIYFNFTRLHLLVDLVQCLCPLLLYILVDMAKYFFSPMEHTESGLLGVFVYQR